MKNKKASPPHPNNLRKLREAAGLTQEDIARVWGVERGDVSQRENGIVSITPRRAKMLTDEYGWTASQIYGDDLPKINLDVPLSEDEHRSNNIAILYNQIIDNFTFVVRAEAIQASAGHGIAVDPYNEENETVAFRASWLKSITNSPAHQLIVITVRGESMEPTLKDGDSVLIDLCRITPNDDGMYVIGYEDKLLVKRVTIDPIRKEIIISSDNHNYSPIKIYNSDEVRVTGRVIWVGRRV